MKMNRYMLMMPVLGAGFLALAAFDLARRPIRGDASKYHAKVHELAYNGGVPERVGDWTWNKNYVEPDTTAANQLLKPNVLIQRQYVLGNHDAVFFLLDQCPDAQDMRGHYPPDCLPTIGLEPVSQRALDLALAGKDEARETVPAMEYIFRDRTDDSRRMIFNFFVMPNGQFAPDIGAVEEASEDFVRRYYGSAQVQFVFELPRGASKSELEIIRGEHQKTVEEFIAAMGDLFTLIKQGGRQ